MSTADFEENGAPEPRRAAHDVLDVLGEPAGFGPPKTRLRTKQAHRQRRLVVVGKLSAAVAAIAVLLATGFTWGTKKWIDDKFRQVAALDLASSSIVDAALQRGDENFLLVGSDSRPGADAEDAAGGPRSDTVMIAHIPQDRSRVVVVSFPRDLQIDRPSCERWDAGTGKYTGERDSGSPGVKINSAYQYGGPRCVTTVVQQLSGLAINHFVGVDFAGFDAMVDAVGGVEVCTKGPVEDEVLGILIDRAGTFQLTGDKALDYVRAGHVIGDADLDQGRVRRQQQLVAALVRRLVSERTLLDPGRLRGFVSAMSASTIADNVGLDQLLELGKSLHGLDTGRVTFVTVPTTDVPDSNGNGIQQLRPEDTKTLFRTLIDGGPLPGEQPVQKPIDQPGAPTGPAPATVPADQIKLQVLNGTGREGLATQVTNELRSVGFGVVKVDNAPQPEEHTVIRYAAAREAQARSVATAVPGAVLHLDPAMGGAVELVLGADFQGAIQPVQLGQAVPAQPAQPAPPAPIPAPSTLETINAADTSCR